METPHISGLFDEGSTTYREIGQKLVISEETVRSHVKNILAKLDQPNRMQAVVAALKLGLITLN